MDEIRRIFVEKKEAFAVEARGLLADLQTNLGMKVSMSSPHTSEDSPAGPKASKVGQKSLRTSFFVYGWLPFYGARRPVSLHPFLVRSACVVFQKGFLPAGKGEKPCPLLPRLGGMKKPLTVSAAASREACPRWA